MNNAPASPRPGRQQPDRSPDIGRTSQEDNNQKKLHSLWKQTPKSSRTYLTRARPCGRSRGGGTNRCGRRAVGSWQTVLVLRIPMRPVWTRIHLRRRRGVALVLGHVMALRLVGRVRRRIGGARGRNRGIYRNNARVRLYVRVIAMAILVPIIEGVYGRTCCLSHTCRTSRLGVRRVMVLRRTGQVFGIRRARSRRRLVQSVVGLGRVGGSARSHLRLGSVLRVGARLRLGGILSSGSSRCLVCGYEFRKCRGGRWIR